VFWFTSCPVQPTVAQAGGSCLILLRYSPPPPSPATALPTNSQLETEAEPPVLPDANTPPPRLPEEQLWNFRDSRTTDEASANESPPPLRVAEHSEKTLPASTMSCSPSLLQTPPPSWARQRSNEEEDRCKTVPWPVALTAPPESSAAHSAKAVEETVIWAPSLPPIAPPSREKQLEKEEDETFTVVPEAKVLIAPPQTTALHSVNALEETVMLENISPCGWANGSPWIAPPDFPDEQLMNVESNTSSCEPNTCTAAPEELLRRCSNLV